MIERKWVTLTVAHFFVLICCSSATATSLWKQIEQLSAVIQERTDQVGAFVGGAEKCGTISPKVLNEASACSSAPRQNKIWSEDIVLQEMAHRSELALKCHLPFIKSLASDKKPLTDALEKFNSELVSRFLAIHPAAQRIRKEREQILDRLYRREMHACNSVEDKMKIPCLPAKSSRLKSRLAALDNQLNVLTLTLPFATDPDVNDNLLALLIRTSEPSAPLIAPNRLKQMVKSTFHGSIKKVYSRMESANNELLVAKKNGSATRRYKLTPSLRTAFLSSPKYLELLKALSVPAAIQKVLICRSNAETKVGPARIQAVVAVASVISMGLSFGGSSLAIAALASTSARVAIIGLDFGINSASLLVSGKQIAESCFAPEHAVDVDVAPNCSVASGGVDFISRADGAKCAVAAVFGASSAVYQSITMIKAARLLQSPAK